MLNVGLTPAGMHHSETVELKPQRDRAEPVEHRPVERSIEAELLEELAMLLVVLRRVRSAIVPACRVDSGIGDGIELVVAEHDLRRSGIDHLAHDTQCLELIVPLPVDDVADEHRPSFRMAPCPSRST